MRVRTVRGLEGARTAQGAVVVIDVLRAFTTAAYALGAGARLLELVSTPEEGLERRREDPALVLVGEVGGRPIAGFDHGNSPERMAALDLGGQRLVLRSSSGVQGALTALPHAARLFLGSFVTAGATVRALRHTGLDVTLVAMGASGPDAALDGPEDDACAELLAARLCDHPVDWPALERRARSGPSARAALDPREDWIRPGDLELALFLDRFDFAVEARREGRFLVARARPAAAHGG
jgi:2-phosphosulfolactate phosphatase